MSQEGAHREAIVEVAVNVIAPTLVLMFLSGEDRLGSTGALVFALAFPLGHGGWTAATLGRISPIAALAFVSVLLTGGIGLLELSVHWFAWKEAAFPLVMGIAAVGSVYSPWPAIPMLLDSLVDPEKVSEKLAERNAADAHEAALRRGTWLIGLIFVGTALGTFAFARYMVVSPTGTEAFNTELGRYTAMSFPVLGVPSTGLMVWVLWGVLLGIEERTGAHLDDLLR